MEIQRFGVFRREMILSRRVGIGFVFVILISLGLCLVKAEKTDMSTKIGSTEAVEQRGVRISLFPLSGSLDPRQVRTATQYFILTHLGRNLVHYNSVGDVEGDLAASWTVDPDFRIYEFRLVSDGKFSDGSPITADDVIATIRVQMKARDATHFDFEQIKSAEAIDTYRVRIILKSSNPNFILQLVHPEFGVLHRSDVDNSSENYSFNPSSGPYTLISADPAKKYVLVKNPYYPHFGQGAPRSLTIEFVPASLQAAEFEAGTLDFSVPVDLNSFDAIQSMLSHGRLSYVVPHIGFTYWLTLNPAVPALRDIRVRNWMQSLIHQYLFQEIPSSGIPWGRAEQLYLPDGVGRPNENDLALAWRKIQRNAENAQIPHRIKILTSTMFPFNKRLTQIFESAGAHVTMDYYDTIDSIPERAKSGYYDAFLINNDFSSVDLLENVLTTFKSADPLIFLPSPDHPIARWVEEANSMQAGERRNALFQKISLSTLEDGLVAPICYRRIAFLHQRKLDISAWSAVFPEIAFWKARLITP